jgi:hypothetical protein
MATVAGVESASKVLAETPGIELSAPVPLAVANGRVIAWPER